MTVPFVGRERELEVLAGLEAGARSAPGPAVAIITGVPGSGKTRLVQEAGRAARNRTIRIVGFEPMQSIALGATAGLLRELSVAPTDGTALGALLQGATDRVPEPVRVFEAAHRAVVRMGPLRLVIDDVQWVDDISLALIDYLVRAAEARRHPLAVVAAGRPSAALAALSRRVADELPPLRRADLELGPLPVAAGTRLARAIDARLSEPGAAELWRRATGSPFYLELLARVHAADDQRSAIAERLRTLDADAGRLLAAASVAGRPILAEDLAAMIGWHVDRVAEIAHGLMTSGVAVESIGGLSPAHDLIREAVLSELPASQRRRFEERLADAIEHDAEGRVLLLREALVHRRAAGHPATSLALRIIESPERRVLSVADLKLLASISDELDFGSPDQMTIDQRVGELAAHAGDLELAINRFARVAGGSADPVMRQRAAIAAARAAYVAGNSQSVRAWLASASEAAPMEPAASIAADAILADTLLWVEHESIAGHEIAVRALGTAEELIKEVGGVVRLSDGARRAYLAALEAAGDAALQLERPADILRLAELSVSVAGAIDEASEIAALNRVAFAYRPLGRIVEAEGLSRRAWEAARRLILPAAMAEAGNSLARSLRDLGRIREAHAIAIETVEIEARLATPTRRWGNALSALHLIELCIQDPAVGLRQLREDARLEPDPHYRMAIHQSLAVWLTRMIAPAADIEAQILAADDASALARCPRCATELRLESAWMLARLGRVAEAEHRLAADPEPPPEAYRQRRVRWLRANAELAAARGNHAEAVNRLETLAALARDSAMVEELIWILIALGREKAHLDRAAAVIELRQAAALSDQIGAVTHGRFVTRALRDLGIRTWRRSPRADVASRSPGVGDLSTLSAREREVAGWIAAGRSNREVGEALDISPKTVERHVTNVLAKLGIRNRTELATLVAGAPVRDFPDE